MVKITIENDGKVKTFESDIIIGATSMRIDGEGKSKQEVILIGESSAAHIADMLGVTAGQVLKSISGGNKLRLTDLYARMDTRTIKVITDRDSGVTVERVEGSTDIHEGSIDDIAADIGKEIAEAIKEVLTPGGGAVLQAA